MEHCVQWLCGCLLDAFWVVGTVRLRDDPDFIFDQLLGHWTGSQECTEALWEEAVETAPDNVFGN